jgi:phosphoenolpyruvate carboxylase
MTNKTILEEFDKKFTRWEIPLGHQRDELKLFIQSALEKQAEEIFTELEEKTKRILVVMQDKKLLSEDESIQLSVTFQDAYLAILDELKQSYVHKGGEVDRYSWPR